MAVALKRCTLDPMLVTPTSNQLELHFSNIERTLTCSFIDDRTRTPVFWLGTNGHRTSNIETKRLSLDLLNIFIEQTRTSFFSNNERTRTFSSFGNRIRTSYFWL